MSANPLVPFYRQLQTTLEDLWLKSEGRCHALVVCRDGRPFIGEGSVFYHYRDREFEPDGWMIHCFACNHSQTPSAHPLERRLGLPAQALYADIRDKIGDGGMPTNAISERAVEETRDWQDRLQLLIQGLSQGSESRPSELPTQQVGHDQAQEQQEEVNSAILGQASDPPDIPNTDELKDQEKQEAPGRLLHLQRDMTEFYVTREMKVHAMVVCVTGKPLSADHGQLNYGPFENAHHVIRCLKCGLQTETRRWKQVRERACKKQGQESKKRIVPRVEDMERGWAGLESTNEFLQQILQGGEHIPPKQRRTLSKICDASRACLERERTRQVINGLGEGGRSTIKNSTLNVGTLRDRAGGFQQMSQAVFVQESMITQAMTRSAQSDASSAGFSFYQGSPARVTRDAMGRMGPMKAEGLALVCQNTVSWFGIKKDLPAGCSLNSRIHSGWLACEDLTVVVHNLYLKTGDTEEAALLNTGILEEVIQRVQGIGHPQQVVLGDFQNRPGDLMTWFLGPSF